MAIAEGWLVPSTKIDFTDPAVIISALARTDLTRVELTASAPQGTLGVAYGVGPDVWVACAIGNLGVTDPNVPPGLWYSTDGGDTWAAATVPDWVASVIIKAVVWTGRRFIAIGGTGSTFPVPEHLIAISDDGRTWTSVDTPLDGVTAYYPSGSNPQSPALDSICGYGDYWFASGPSLSSVPFGSTLPGDIFLVAIYSHDGGLTWSNATMPTFYDPVAEFTYSGSVGQAQWDGAKFVGLEAGSYNTQSTYESADGSSWELTGLGPMDPDFLYGGVATQVKLAGVLYQFGGRLNAITFLNDPVYYSSTDDGASWAGPFPDLIPPDPYNFSILNQVVHDVIFRSSEDLLKAIEDGNDWLPDIYFARGDPASWDSVDTGLATYWGGIQSGAVPFMDYGKFGGAVPLRRYPRNDGLSASTQRRLPPPTTTQSGLRRGPTAVT